MASSSAARLCMLACRQTRPLWRMAPAMATRTMHTSAPRRANKEDGGDEDDMYRQLDLKRMNKSFVESATPERLRQLDELAKSSGHGSVEEYVEETLRGFGSEDRSLEEELYKDDVGERPNKSSFWYDEDDPETNTEEHDEFDEDDITSMAHGKLDEIREMRQYARLTVWEMPLLAKLAKPFEPPSEDQVLRWRYTSYMGESHPAEKKVVVQFAPDDLGLLEWQTNKLKKLAGARYDPETELVKMSCESFEHQAQNKRYLAKLVDDLIAAAKDSKDSFEDVPLDTRHHKVRAKPKFPPQWRMTEERRRELDEGRQRLAAEEVRRVEGGGVVDGKKVIDEYLMKRLAEEQAKVPQMVAAPTPGKTRRYL